jgi:hypothetical protein
VEFPYHQGAICSEQSEISFSCSIGF